MARDKQSPLDLPAHLKGLAALKGKTALAPALPVAVPPHQDLNADAKLSGMKPGVQSPRRGKRKDPAVEVEQVEQSTGARELDADGYSDGSRLANATGEALPQATDSSGFVGLVSGAPVQLAQLELPSLPKPSASDAGAGSATASTTGGLWGSVAGVFGAVAGLGLAAGGGGGEKSAGSTSPVVVVGPTTAAPAPQAPASEVISLFSDSYTNVSVNNWNPNWGQTGDLSDAAPVGSNQIKRVLDLNYQGVQIATFGNNNAPVSGVLDVSSKGYLHIDYWLEEAGSFTLNLISKNGTAPAQEDGVRLSGEAGWNSVDISLAEFNLVDLSKIVQLVFIRGTASDAVSQLHFDNLYFAGTYAAPLEGRLVNGYISDAEVFQDLDDDGELDNNRDGTLDPGEEVYATTDDFGRFTLVGASPTGGTLIAQPTNDTVDRSTLLPVSNVFKAPAGAQVISPLSTLLEAGSDSGLNEAQLKAAFGIDASISLLSFNPVQAIEDAIAGGDAAAANLALKLKASNVAVSNLMDVGSSLLQGAQSSSQDFSSVVVNILVEAIQAAPSAPLNLASAAVVGEILGDAATAAGVDAGGVQAVISSTAGHLAAATQTMNTTLSAVSNVSQASAAMTTMSKVEKAVQDTISTAVNQVAQNPANVDDLTDIDLAEAVERADVGTPSFQTLNFEAGENLRLDEINGATATTPQLSGNTVVKVIKPAGADDLYNASGVSPFTTEKTLVIDGATKTLKTLAPLDLVSNDTLGMWVHSSRAGTTVTLEVGDSARGGWPKDGNFVSARAVTSKAGWEYVAFDFGQPVERYVQEGNPDGAVARATILKSGVTYDMLNVFFDLGQSKGSAQTYYFDKLGYYTDAPGAEPAAIAIESIDPVPTGYTISWRDEFGGDLTSTADAPKTALDAQKWGRDLGQTGWGNGESQDYTDSLDNAYLQNGALHIVAEKSGGDPTSARLKSIPDVGPNSYVEVRAKLPVGQGAWPAIWLLGQGNDWPDKGEIDIMEWSSRYFQPNTVQAALHFRGDDNPVDPNNPSDKSDWTYGDTQKKGAITLGTPVTEFQTYQVWWTQDYVRFGVNGNSDNFYYQYEKPEGASAAHWPFTDPMDLILNLAIGGTLGGTVPTEDFKYQMVVDYVRVYQANTSAPTSVTVSFDEGGTGGYTLGHPEGQPDSDFGGAVSSMATNPPTGASGAVAQVLKTDGAQTWAGTTFLSLPAGELITASSQTATMRVWSPDAGTVVRLKLEDASDGTKTVETEAVTTQAGAWQTLTFNFANPVAGTNPLNHASTFNKASVFFDFGTAGSGKVFYFDDVKFLDAVTPPVTAPTSVTVSFDEGGTGGYTLGHPEGQPDSDFGGAVSSMATNPPTGASGAVAQVLKTDGAQTWAGTTFLSLPAGELITASSQTATMRVWSPDAGTVVRLKLEDASDGTKTVETEAVTTQAGAWQTLTFNFANPVAGTNPLNHASTFNKASVFFDFGTAGSGKVFYFDDVKFLDAVTPPVTAPTSVTVSFDEGGTGGYTLGHPEGQPDSDFGGAVSSMATNPPTGASGAVAQVLKTDGAQTWAGTTFLSLPAGELITASSQTATMRVWSPDAGTVVRLKLEDASDGTKTVETEAVTTQAGAWQTLTFNFANPVAGTNPLNHASTFNKASVFFDFGTAGSGKVFYFDDVKFLDAVTPPVTAPTSVTVSFDEGGTGGYTLGHPEGQPDSDFGGAVSSMATNPPTGASGAVAQVLKTDGAQTWAGTTFLSLPAGELITASSQTATMRVWSPDAGTVVRLKLEDASDGTKTVETEAVTTQAGAWQTLTFNFANPVAGTNPLNHASTFNKASVFFDFGTAGSGKVFYFDDVKFLDAVTPPVTAPTSVTVSFDEGGTGGYTLGHPEGQPDSDFGGAVSSMATNPPTGASGAVAQVLKTDGAQTWAGTTFLSLPAGELITASSQTATMRVWSPDAGTVVRLKLEDASDGTKTVETEAVTTQAGAWQTLTFNFANPVAGTNPLNHASTFNKASVFFDFGTAGSGKVFYFDDVKFLDAVTPPVTAPTSVTVSFDEGGTGGYTLGHPEGQPDSDFGGAVSSMATNPPTGASGAVAQVLKTDGAQTWAGTTFLSLPAGELITASSQTATMRVWSPDAGTVVRLKLEDASDGTKTVETEAVTTQAGAWQTLTFNFANPVAGTNPLNHASTFNKASVFFDFGTAGSGKVFYFDDVKFLDAVTPPVTAPTSVTVSFDEGGTGGYTLGHPEGQPDSDFGGAVSSMATNPPTGASGAVAQVLKTDGAQTWAGTTFLSLPAGELITASSQTATMRVWSPDAGTVVRLKLEDASDGTKTVETEAVTTQAGAWQTLTFNFANPVAGTNPLNHASTFNKASVFFDFGTAGSGKVFYFDDVKFLDAVTVPTSSPSYQLITNEFNNDLEIESFQGAVTSYLSNELAPEGSHGSVIEFEKPVGAMLWAGATIATLADQEFIAAGSTEMSLRVWSQGVGKTVRLKLEDANDGTKTVETEAVTTQAGAWQTLNFNFANPASGTNPLNHASTFNKASVFFDFMAPATGQTFYFDDLTYNTAVIQV